MARALAWHARGHRFDPDILHRASALLVQTVLIIQITLRETALEIFDILTQARL